MGCQPSTCGWAGSDVGYACGGEGEDPTGSHPGSCGCAETKLEAEPRVFNGTAEPTAACLTPGQILAVGALAEPNGAGYENFCTATLIAPDVVLTAAHCLLDGWGATRDPSTVFFLVGQDVATPDHVFSIQELHAHPGYDWDAAHDIGVALLSEPAHLAVSGIEPIPFNGDPLEAGFVGVTVQNVGYGVTHDNQQNTERWWTAQPVVELHESEFVVYGQGWSSVCYGDSGGPSIHTFTGTSEGAIRVVGTVSWGDQSCVDYDHFARTDDNTPFLDTHVDGWDPCGDLDYSGRCAGSIAQWCDGGIKRQECCANGCGVDPTGNHRCLSTSGGCGEIDWLGECSGDRLIWCRQGEVVSRFCNLCGGQSCAWVDDVRGHDCVD